MLFKKEETVESLTKKCNNLYKEFNRTITLAHYKRHYELKKEMKGYFQIIKEKIENQNNDEIKKLLLNHFKEQLIFFEKNPFSCDEKKELLFMEKNFPYLDKINSIEKNQANNKLKIKKG